MTSLVRMLRRRKSLLTLIMGPVQSDNRSPRS